MSNFETKEVPKNRDVVAPDGSDVRILLELKGGGMAHFSLAPGATSHAVTHRTVEEIWYFVSGQGEMWRKQDGQEQIVEVFPGICLTIPLGTSFQFRCTGKDPLEAICITMPPWPGKDEAVLVEGPWRPTAGEQTQE
jgi:mannose-6-phosphate isomerase-like protein (cupin superfamily)